MSIIKVYTDCYSIFDVRRCLLTQLGLDHNPNFKWDIYKPIFDRRRYEYFNQPDLGIIHEDYKNRLNNLNVEDWGYVKQNGEDEVLMLPTQLLNSLFSIVRQTEFGVHKTIMTSQFSLVVNMYPFEFDNDTVGNLINYIKGLYRFPVDVKVIDVPHQEINASLLTSFNYVFCYYLLLNNYYEKFFNTFAKTPIPETKYVVPELLTEVPCITPEKDLPAEMREESISDIMLKYSTLTGGRLNLLPVDKNLFSAS